MTSEKNAQLGQARETFQMLYQISQLLCTGLDQETLTTCIKLCELGVDPEVLAHVIREIRKIGQARETFQMLYQISQLLCTGLDQETLTTCIKLCELGVDPEVLAHVIREIRKIGENSAPSKPGTLQP